MTSLRAWLQYKSDNLFAAGPVVIISLLALISLGLILLFSSFYLWSGQASTYSESVWETFMRTLGGFRSASTPLVGTFSSRSRLGRG